MISNHIYKASEIATVIYEKEFSYSSRRTFLYITLLLRLDQRVCNAPHQPGTFIDHS